MRFRWPFNATFCCAIVAFPPARRRRVGLEGGGGESSRPFRRHRPLVDFEIFPVDALLDDDDDDDDPTTTTYSYRVCSSRRMCIGPLENVERRPFFSLRLDTVSSLIKWKTCVCVCGRVFFFNFFYFIVVKARDVRIRAYKRWLFNVSFQYSPIFPRAS